MDNSETGVTIKFDFTIGEMVYNKPPDGFSNNSYPAGKPVSYQILSRLYEEISGNLEGAGITSYVVRHIDPSTPGGGKLYKFSQDELISKNAYEVLCKLAEKDQKSEPYPFQSVQSQILKQLGTLHSTSNPTTYTVATTTNTPF